MRPLLPFAAFLLVACGASTQSAVPTDGGSSDAATNDATSDATSDEVRRGDGGCLLPTEGAACSKTDVVCPVSGNICCIGYVWSCDAASGRWTKVGVGCACMSEDTGATADSASSTDVSVDAARTDAGPFACGSQTCAPNQVCTRRPPGIPTDAPSLYYACTAMPTACVSNPTCACVKGNIEMSCYPTDCEIDGAGHVTVDCMGV